MGSRNFLLFLVCGILSFSFGAIAEQDTVDVSQKKSVKKIEEVQDDTQYQKVIDEYKDYVSKIPSQVRDEVVTYRKEVASLNREKKEKYKKLSQEAQGYLSKEQEYRKKLPIKHKKLINIQQPVNVDKK